MSQGQADQTKPTSRKVLGQTAPGAAVETTLYTVPAGIEATISSISVCNRVGSVGLFSIAVCPNGVATGNEHYIYYQTPTPAKETFAADLGWTLDGGDVIRCLSGTGFHSFSLFGSEENI